MPSAHPAGARRVRWAGALLLAGLVLSALGPPSGRPAVAPAGGEIVFVRFTAQAGHPRLCVVGPTGANVTRLRLPLSAAAGPAWSPDGRKLAFIGGRNVQNENTVTVGDDLYVAAADGSGAHRLTHDSAHEAGPSWAPDGKRIVFLRSARAGNRSSLWIIGVDDGTARRLTRRGIDLEPSWSPDGRWIAFLRIDPITYHSGIWLVRPDGSGLRRVVSHVRNVSDPVWSPDGSRLVLTDGATLLVLAPDGSHRQSLARLAQKPSGGRVDPQPAWSPDGRRIVFVQPRTSTPGHSDLWTVGADGRALRRLTRSPGLDTDPSWRP